MKKVRNLPSLCMNTMKIFGQRYQMFLYVRHVEMGDVLWLVGIYYRVVVGLLVVV